MPSRPTCLTPSCLVLLPLLAACRVPAQTPAPAKPAAATTAAQPVYDVATIRPNTSGSGNENSNTRPATLQAENLALKSLLERAYGVRRNLIFGLPSRAENAHYDINAKVLDGDLAALRKLSDEQRRKMLQILCEQRFGLKWHFETRPIPDLELVVAKGGAKLQPAPTNSKSSGTSVNNDDLTATAISISSLIDVISPQVDRPVFDRTGLAGVYTFKLRWSSDSAHASPDNGESADTPPPLYTALQEQLGLKLQPGKDPIQTLVVDSISPPSEN